MTWLDHFAQTRSGDAERLARTGIHSAAELLERITSYRELRAVAQSSGVQEHRLLTFAVQAQFHRLRPAPIALAS